MHENARAHRNAAELHAAEYNEKGDEAAGSWHSQRALEYSDQAYKLAREAHNKSAQIVTL